MSFSTLKESGLIAEEQSSRIITQEHINQAVSKFQEFQIRNKQDLPDPTQDLLEFIKTNQNKASQELYNLYSPKTSYKTFHRRLQEMEKAGLVNFEKQGRLKLLTLTKTGSEVAEKIDHIKMLL